MSYALLGYDSNHNKIEVFIDDRLYHTYLVGSTGYGKTQLITSLVLQDAKLTNPKQGLLVLDPLGGLVDNILHYLPRNREDDVVLLQLDAKHPVWGMNLYECPDITNQGEVDKAMERVMRVWNKIFGITKDTPLLETLMRNLSYAIIFNPPYTIIEIPRFLRDKAFRQQLTANIPYEEVRWFWEDFDQLSKHDYREQVDAVRRRFDAFLIPTFKPIIGQYKSTINFVNLMNEGKIVLVKMNPELPSASQLMGSILISLLLMAAYARPIGERKQFNLYVDEFQQFAGKEFSILYENARQFKLGALVSQQHRSQIPPELAELAESLMMASTYICLQTTPQTAKDLATKFDNTPPVSKETIRKPKQSVSQDPITHLVTRGHSNPTIRSLAENVLASLVHDIEKLRRDVSQAHGEVAKFLSAFEIAPLEVPDPTKFKEQAYYGYVGDYEKALEEIKRLLIGVMEKRIIPGSKEYKTSLLKIMLRVSAWGKWGANRTKPDDLFGDYPVGGEPLISEDTIKTVMMAIDMMPLQTQRGKMFDIPDDMYKAIFIDRTLHARNEYKGTVDAYYASSQAEEQIRLLEEEITASKKMLSDFVRKILIEAVSEVRQRLAIVEFKGYRIPEPDRDNNLFTALPGYHDSRYHIDYYSYEPLKNLRQEKQKGDDLTGWHYIDFNYLTRFHFDSLQDALNYIYETFSDWKNRPNGGVWFNSDTVRELRWWQKQKEAIRVTVHTRDKNRRWNRWDFNSHEQWHEVIVWTLRPEIEQAWYTDVMLAQEQARVLSLPLHLPHVYPALLGTYHGNNDLTDLHRMSGHINQLERQLKELIAKTQQAKAEDEERKKVAHERAEKETQRFFMLLASLDLLMRELAEDPILVDAGQFDEIPASSKPHSEIQSEIENEIIHLAPGQARARLKQEPINLKTKVCHRCGKVHPITGEIKDGKKHVTFLPDVCEDCKIPIRTEYLITLAQPEDEKDKDGNPKFPYVPNIEPRVKRIIENNLRQGYLRKREDVEKEIAARQQDFTSPKPAPVATEKAPPKQPPTPPPMERQNKII